MNAERIVSLLPGGTDIVCALGLEDRLVGISAECDQPATVMDRPRVSLSLLDTGEAEAAEIDRRVRDRLAAGEPLFRADHEALAALRPDLILSQSLCDVCAATPDALTAAAVGDARVLALDGRDLDGLLADIHNVAAAAGATDHGQALVDRLVARRLAIGTPPAPRPRVLTVEWPDPLFIGGHWVPDMVVAAGGEPLGQPGAHSTTVSWEAVQAFDPEVILIMPCGEDLTGAAAALASLRRRPGWPALSAVQSAAVYLLDGNRHFSRPGPGAFTGLEIIAHILGTGQQDPAAGYWRPASPSECRADR
jgi:iron complex transport system substrate-binding protein